MRRVIARRALVFSFAVTEVMVVMAVVAGSSLICRICVAQPAASSPSGAVVLEAKDEASVNVTAARATIDGAQVVDRLDGVPIEVSPGTHHVVFEAAGFRRSESTFVVTEGQRLRVVVFLIATPAEIIMSLPAHPDEPEPARPTSNRQRTVGLAVAGAGLAGIAVGSIWSLMSRSTYDDALSNECGGNPGGCSAQGIADGKTAHSQAMVATIGFVAGGVLLAAGAALYFTGPKRNGAGLAVAPALDGAGHAGMMLAGAW